ncbi:MAG: hypothetical protein UZ14_CFX002000445 [Chloroflexi bacterium OLB14]|nr:MAG: hypothetical protein UZ14_CFX002000445 [Chloroflexi bacterium OLB14]
MDIKFSGKIIFWKGPSPFFFVQVPKKQSKEIKSVSALVTYGWGVIPVTVKVGKTEFTTSLFPKDGAYLVPLKVIVRKKENLEEGDTVKINLKLNF